MEKHKIKRHEKKILVSFYHHRSARSLIFRYYSLSKKSSLDTEVYLKQFTHKHQFGPVEDAIDIIKEKRCWGFCRKAIKKNEPAQIHFWFDKSCKVLEILHLIAHEVTHSTGIKSENIADRTATIASFALYSLSLHFRDKIKLKN